MPSQDCEMLEQFSLNVHTSHLQRKHFQCLAQINLEITFFWDIADENKEVSWAIRMVKKIISFHSMSTLHNIVKKTFSCATQSPKVAFFEAIAGENKG